MLYIKRLACPEIHAIQWLPGTGNGNPPDWIETYQKIQAAGKSLQLDIGISELDTMLGALKPEGVWLSVWNAKDRAEADEVLRRVSRWTS